MVIIIHTGSSYFKHSLLSESEFWAKIILKVLKAGVIAVNFMKWSTALTLSSSPSLPALAQGFYRAKNPVRWPRGSTDEARSSPRSDSGNSTGPGMH